MRDVFIVEAVRRPLGRRRGGLSTVHAGDLLGAVQRPPWSERHRRRIDQVIGGCVSQVGEQSFNVARTAWLAQGLPWRCPPPPSTASAGPANRRPRSRRVWSARGWQTWL